MGKRTSYFVAAASALSLAAAFVAGYSCRKGQQVPEGEVIARVGDAVLTQKDLDRLDQDQRLVKSPTYLSKRELMEEWVRSEVILRDALRRKIDQDEETAWRLANVRKGILVNRYWEILVYDKKQEVTPEEAKAWYEANKGDFRTKEDAVWLRRAVFSSREDAEKAIARVKAGEDFEGIVRLESVSPEKLGGGSQGYRRLSDMVGAYGKEVAEAPIGTLIGPLPRGKLWMVVKIEDRVAKGDYLKAEGLGIEYLQERAKVDWWVKESERIGNKLMAAPDVKRYPERIKEEAVDMAHGEKEELPPKK